MKRLAVALLAILAVILTTHGQTSEQIVPVDTALRQGVLPNGMTYYVRKAVSKKHISGQALWLKMTMNWAWRISLNT